MPTDFSSSRYHQGQSRERRVLATLMAARAAIRTLEEEFRGDGHIPVSLPHVSGGGAMSRSEARDEARRRARRHSLEDRHRRQVKKRRLAAAKRAQRNRRQNIERGNVTKTLNLPLIRELREALKGPR